MPQNYLIIPRRFRPKIFQEVVGQQPIVTTLKNALRFKRFAHAYLFCGARGTGKTTLARLFAKALNCTHLTDSLEPCNACSSCQEIHEGRSLDVLEIDGASNRGIDDIRQINETVGYTPTSSPYKIYIIDEVHMLTKEAFNALLKTLEEPPSTVKFFFATTEAHKIPQTITSRCQRFELARISEEVIAEKLSSVAQELKLTISNDALLMIAKYAEGSLRDAESLLDLLICYADGKITEESVSSHLGLVPKDMFFSLDKAVSNQEISYAFSLIETLYHSGKDLGLFYHDLMDHFRLLLLVLLKQRLPPLGEEEKKQIFASAKHYTQDQCLYILDFLMQEWEHLSKTPIKRVHLEMILLHILRSKNRVSLASLTKRLCELSESPQEPVQIVERVSSHSDAQDAEKAPLVDPQNVKTLSEIIHEPEKPLPFEKKEEIKTTPKTRYDTLLRFAAVELEGTLHR